MTNQVMSVKSIKMSDCVKKYIIKVKIKGMIVFKIRTFIGCQIMKIGALIIGCGIEINSEQN